jgi:hypothetical protein
MIKKLLSTIVLSILCAIAFAQVPTFEWRMENEQKTSPTTYQFDVNLYNKSASAFELRGGTVAFIFDSLWIKDGSTVGTITLTTPSSSLTAGQQTGAAFFTQKTNVAQPFIRKIITTVGAGTGTTIPANSVVKCFTIVLTNTVAFSNTVPPKFAWKFNASPSAGFNYTDALGNNATAVANIGTGISNQVNCYTPVYYDGSAWTSKTPHAGLDTTFTPTSAHEATVYNGTVSGNLTCRGYNIMLGATHNLTSNETITIGTELIGNGGTVSSSGNLLFNGNIRKQSINVGMTLNNITIDNSFGLDLSGPTTVTNNLNLVSGKVFLGNNNFTVGSAATISNGSGNSYVVINGTGKFKVNNLGAGGRTSAFTFPIGTTSGYNPITIQNSGTADNFQVAVVNGVSSGGGALTTNAVNRSWSITEEVTGGSVANISLQWNASDELSSFNRTNSYLAALKTSDNNWYSGSTGAASGSSPYTQSINGFSDFANYGLFGVGSNGALNNGSLNPLPIFEWRLENERMVNANTYQFDVNIYNTGSNPFEIRGGTIAFLYNSAWANGGTLSITTPAGLSGMSAGQQGGATSVVSSGTAYLRKVINNVGAGVGTTIPGNSMVRCYTIIVTNTAAFSTSSSPNFAWKFNSSSPQAGFNYTSGSNSVTAVNYSTTPSAATANQAYCYTPAYWTGSAWNTGSQTAGSATTLAPSSIQEANIYSGTYNGSLDVRGYTLMSGATHNLASSEFITVRTELNNYGTLNSSSGTINFFGFVRKQTSYAALTSNNVAINNSLGLSIGGNMSVLNNLNLTAGNIFLGNNNLIIGNSGSISNASSSSYVVSDGNGMLKKNNLGITGEGSSYPFPIGISTSYTPILIQNAGTTDNFSVSVSQTDTTDNSVNLFWKITEDVAGGSNTILTFQWNAADELPLFDRNNSYISAKKNNENYWIAGTAGSAAGTNPYTQLISGISDFTNYNLFAIGSNSKWRDGSIIYATYNYSLLPKFEWRLENEKLISPNTYQFDVNIYNTSSTPFEVRGGTIAFLFNSAWANGGTLSLTSPSSGMAVTQQAGANNVVNTGATYFRKIISSVGAGSGTMIPANSSIKCFTLVLTNTTSFSSSATPNFAWKFNSSAPQAGFNYTNGSGNSAAAVNYNVAATVATANQVFCYAPSYWNGTSWNTGSQTAGSVSSTAPTSVNEANIYTGTYNGSLNIRGYTLMPSATHSMDSNGVLEVRTELNNYGTLNSSSATISFKGNVRRQKTISAITSNNITLINNSLGLTLGGNMIVNNSLNLTSGNIFLGNNNLTIGNSASISNASSASYVVTEGNGLLKINSLGTTGRTSSMIFPVGISSSYNPVILQNSGTLDNFQVGIINGVTANGSILTSNAINKTWKIIEDVSGGSNASFSLQWNSSDELASFDRANSYVAAKNILDNNWYGASASSAFGSSPYVQSFNGFNNFSNYSSFAVGSGNSLNQGSLNSGLGWVNLQYPQSASLCSRPMDTLVVFGQVYESGLTEAFGQGAGITVQYGYSNTNSHPSTWTNWQNATYNPLCSVCGNGTDEYFGAFSGLAAGTYYYTFRYKLGNGSYQYGGFNQITGGGFWDGSNNMSGVLTVKSPIQNVSILKFGTFNPIYCVSGNPSFRAVSSDSSDYFTWSASPTIALDTTDYKYGTNERCDAHITSTTVFTLLANNGVCPSAEAYYIAYVLQPTSSSTNITICSNLLPYTWNNTSYNSAGTYVVHLTNAAGCDSTATLNLSVNFCNPTLNLTVLLEGLYNDGIGAMIPAPFSADGISPTSIADTVTVELHSSTAPYAKEFSITGTISTAGIGTFTFPVGANGNSYYIVIKHRNSIETWSANPVLLTASGSGTSYNFSNNVSKAFADNLSLVGTGKYAIYTGDINQDGSVDFNDYPELDISTNNGDLGYYVTDLNGDASVDFNDYPVLDVNTNIGIITITP